MDINFKAVFLACQVFGKYFVERGRPASIINLGSISGLNPLSRVFSYSASKGAVIGMTLPMARDCSGIAAFPAVPHRPRSCGGRAQCRATASAS